MTLDDVAGRGAYTDDHEAFRRTVRAFLQKEGVPNVGDWEANRLVPREFWRKAGEIGMLCPTVPEEYGGLGLDFGYNAVVTEEMSYNGVPAGFSLQSDIVCDYIIAYGSEEQKRQWLPRLVSGETITAIAMTEPGTGSDLQSIRTTAKKDGNHYVVSGSKTYITNGQNADLIVVVAKTDPNAGSKGISLILVEANREGFKRGRNLDKIGLHASDTSELFFDNVAVPPENLLGSEEGQGFVQLMQQLPQERLALAVGAVAAMERAVKITAAYTKERTAFGKPLLEFQNTAFTLAERKTEAMIARVFVDWCIERLVAGDLDTVTASMAKYWCSDKQVQTADECLQLFGGYGYMQEYPISRMFIDSRIQKIYGGTNEIMKLLIARSL